MITDLFFQEMLRNTKGRLNLMSKCARGIYKRGKILWICYKNGENRIVRESARTDDFKKAESLLALRRKAAVSPGAGLEKVCGPFAFSDLAEKYHAFASTQKS
jgi:hypothetical protein